MSSNWISALISFGASASHANDQRREAEYEASMLYTNAALARKQAEEAVTRGMADTMVVRQKALSLIGSQRASMAAQGIRLDVGSAVDVVSDTVKLAEVDAATVRNNAAREAWGFNTQATNYENQANLTRLSGRNRSRTTMITGGLEAYRLWNK